MYTSPSGKSYIGQTRQSLKRRKADSKGCGYKGSYYFHNAISKYGFDTFTSKILHKVENDDVNKLVEELNRLEIASIKEHKTIQPLGYNISVGGRGNAISEETRSKIRQKLIGVKHTPERRLNQSLAKIGYIPWNKGKKTPFSEERSNQQAETGRFNLHKRWHIDRNIKKDNCKYCA